MGIVKLKKERRLKRRREPWRSARAMMWEASSEPWMNGYCDGIK